MAINFLNDGNFLDNAKLTFGTSGDLEIYHDGSNSYINDDGTGDLYIQTNGTNMFLRDKSSGNTFIAMNTGTEDVSLKQGGNTKLTTTSTGVAVTGNATISTISNASSDTDKFLVSDSGEVKYRTGAQVRSDIGAGTGSGSVTSVAVTVGTGLDVSGSPITSSGTIDIDLDLTELTLGSGLDSTATGLSLDLSEFTDMTAAMVGTDEFIVLDSSAERRKAANEIGLSIFDNDAGFTTNTGTVTGTGGANRIAYWSSSTALTNDSKFTFNGTTLGLTGSNAVLNIGSGGAGTTSLFAWTGDTFYIQQDSASGNIQIETDDFIVKNHGASETYIRAQDNSSVELYYNNVKKFETTAVGVTVSGEITSSSVAYAPFGINRGVQNNPFGNNPGNAIKLFNLVGSSSMGSAPSSAGGDTYWVAPGAGRIRSITIRNVKDTPTSGNTRFKIYKNGANLYTSSYITPTSGGSVGQSVQLNDIDHSFANLDRIQIGFQGETSGTDWGSCALTIVYELSDYSFN